MAALYVALVIAFTSHSARAQAREHAGQVKCEEEREHREYVQQNGHAHKGQVVGDGRAAWGDLKAGEKVGVEPGEGRGRESLAPQLFASDVSEKVRTLRESEEARRILFHCRRLGMHELTDEAFGFPAPEGLGRPGCTVLPMRNPRGDRFFSALVFREADAAAVAVTVDTSTGELVQVISAEGEEEPVSLDRKKWAECFAVSCSVCIAGCAFTGPLWLKCMAACCGVSAAVCLTVSLQE